MSQSGHIEETVSGEETQQDRIERKLDALLQFCQQLEGVVDSAQQSPMVKQMLRQFGVQ